MVAANSARLVWDDGWPVGRCGWSAKSAGWGGDGRRTVRVGVEMVGEECGVGWRWWRRTVLGWFGTNGGPWVGAVGRRRVRGGVEMVGEQCGLGWRWSANSAGFFNKI